MARPCCNLLLSLAILAVALMPLALASRNPANLEFLETIEQNTHSSANPCDDFYSYACGGYARHMNYMDVHTNQSTFTLNTFDTVMELLLTTKYPSINSVPRSNQKVYDKMAAYYYSCKSVDSNFHLRNYFDHIDLKFPLVEAWKAAGRNFNGYYDVMAWSYGFDPAAEAALLYSYGVRKINIGRDFEGSEIELKPRDMDSFKVADIERYLHTFDVDPRKFSQYRNDIIEAQAVLEVGEGEETTFEEDLGLAIIRNFAINDRMTLEDKEQYRNYLMVKLMYYLEKNHNKDCMTNLREKFGLAVNYMFYENIYLPEARQRNADISEVIKTIEHYYAEIIEENKFEFSAEDVRMFKKYLFETNINIGNLVENIDMNRLNNFYISLPDFATDNFYQNDLALLSHRNNEVERCTGEYKMVCDSLLTAPAYDDEVRVLALPFVSLQSPMYDSNWDPVFKLSTLGFEVARGLTRAVVPQMAYSLDEEQVAGIYVLAVLSLACKGGRSDYENRKPHLDEMLGAQVAFKAFSHKYRSQPDFTNIPGDQLFFRSLAQQYCTSNDKSKHAMTTDVQKTRLHDIVKNMDEFAQAFHCSPNDRMFKDSQCRFY